MSAPYFVSSVPYFKAALLARLQALPLNDGTVTICRGNPYPKTWERDAVIINAATGRTRTMTAGMRQCNEEYDVEIFTNRVSNPNDPHSGNEDRAYELMDAVEGDIMDWVMVGGPLLTGAGWGQIDHVELGQSYDREGLDEAENGKVISRDAAVVLPLHVTARLIRNG